MKQKQTIKVYLSSETKQLFAELASDRDMSLSNWLVQSGLSYARSAKRSKPKNAEALHWPSGWSKEVPCHVCKAQGKTAFHDPLGEHPDIGGYDSFELNLGKVQR